MSISVRRLQPADCPRWDAYVQASPQATFFHRAGWQRVLEDAFGHTGHFLYAEQSGEICGVLPLAHVRSRLFGNSLSSLPFCVYGGVAADSDAAAAALRDAAVALATELGVDALELRNLHPGDEAWLRKELYVTFRKAIEPDNDVNLKAIPNRQRAMVRKGIQSGLAAEATTEVGRLYRVYAESVRNLGTPVFGRRYLEILRDEFGDDCRMLMITQGGEDVAGVLSFYFRDEVLPYYGGSVTRARDIKGCNHFMYWALLAQSAEEGLRRFDFGRSKLGTGPFAFKKNFGFDPEPLPYEYFLVRASEMPNVSPANPRYRMMVRLWQQLPLPLANRLGPLIAGSLG